MFSQNLNALTSLQGIVMILKAVRRRSQAHKNISQRAGHSRNLRIHLHGLKGEKIDNGNGGITRKKEQMKRVRREDNRI